MASSGKSNGYDIPSSIVSLPTRLQRKIKKETEIEPIHHNNNHHQHHQLNHFVLKTNKVNEPETYSKSEKKFIDDEQMKNLNALEEHLKSALKICTHQEKKESAENSNQIILTKEKSQLSLKDCHGSSMRKPNQIYSEPSWFKSSKIFEKNDYWRKKMQELSSLHAKYFELLNDELYLENWSLIMDYRKTMAEIFSLLLENNLKFCCKENIEMYFWKMLYYNFIERLRKNMQQQQQSSGAHVKSLKSKAMILIKDGFDYYEEKLKYLEQKYFQKSHSTNSNQKYEILARILMQKILIHLGDLSRYKEQIEMGNNFSLAKQYYQRAQKLVPSNGIPYNQLAIIAIYHKKTFEAIYCYMRSLCASNPIYSAKESLKELFDELRKKHEENNPQQFGVKTTSKSSSSVVENLQLPLKKEIWINSDGSRRLHRLSSNNPTKEECCLKETFFNDYTSDELLKRFTTNYLYVLGKLFTGIGMENFTKISHEMLIEFKTIIFHNPLIFQKNRLLQLTTLNIFTVEQNREREKFNGSKELYNHAFNISSLIFGIILNRANHGLKEIFRKNNNNDVGIGNSSSPVLQLTHSNHQSKPNTENKHSKSKLTCPRIPLDLKILLQSIKVWCDWLKKNITYWNPPIPLTYFNVHNDYELNPWNGLAELITLISSINLNIETNTEHSLLPEDIYLKGFLPLNPCTDLIEEGDNSTTEKDEETEVVGRFKSILQFGLETLCQCQPVVFEKVLDAEGDLVYIKNVVKDVENEEENAIESFENVDSVDYPEEEIPPTQKINPNTERTVEENSDVLELIKRKQELEEKTKIRETYQQKLECILKNSGIIFHIEVRPKYLVPDTNCFIDFLDLLQAIVNRFKKYILAIPIVVYQELEGLSKGFKIANITTLQASSCTIRHFDEVTIRAREALEFIKSRHPLVKCVTTKGSILNTPNFILEEIDDGQNSNSNDDRILSTAVNLSNRTNIENKNKGKIFIQTEVVLMTTDRNLRVKALSRNLSVSQLKEFISWANNFHN